MGCRALVAEALFRSASLIADPLALPPCAALFRAFSLFRLYLFFCQFSWSSVGVAVLRRSLTLFLSLCPDALYPGGLRSTPGYADLLTHPLSSLCVPGSSLPLPFGCIIWLRRSGAPVLRHLGLGCTSNSLSPFDWHSLTLACLDLDLPNISLLRTRAQPSGLVRISAYGRRAIHFAAFAAWILFRRSSSSCSACSVPSPSSATPPISPTSLSFTAVFPRTIKGSRGSFSTQTHTFVSSDPFDLLHRLKDLPLASTTHPSLLDRPLRPHHLQSTHLALLLARSRSSSPQ